MTFKIETVTIQDFRGIRRLTLPFNGRNLIIAGENGSGKSSVIDALEYLFTDHVSKLKGRQDVRENWAIPHLQGETPAVSLYFSGDGEQPVTAEYPAGKISLPDQFRSFVDLAASRRFILRREQILNFVTARPGDRYSQISELIGLAELDEIEGNWKRKRDALSKQRKKLEEDLAIIKGRISELLEKPVELEQDLIHAINRELANHNLNAIFNRNDLKILQEKLAKQGIPSEKQEQLRQLTNLRKDVRDAFASLETLAAHLQSWRECQRAFIEMSAVLTESDFEKLLDEAQQLVDQRAPMQFCPVCEQPILDSANFLGRLQQRLESLQELTRARRTFQESAKDLGNSLHQYVSNIKSLQQDLTDIVIHSDPLTLDGQLAELNEWQNALGDDSSTSEGLIHSDRLSDWHAALDHLNRDLEQETAVSAIDDEELARLELFEKLNRLDENWRQIEVTAAKLTAASNVEQQVEILYESLLEARRRGVTQLGQELEEDFANLYQVLHPDEGYDSITIPVQPEKRGSIDLNASFHDQGEAHPLNYFSEGHLDSLGLCIFLAFIKRFNSDLKLIALDDVLTTVDAGHRLKVARLLARHFADYQLIVTTHDQLWAKELARIIPSAHVVPLKPWSWERGADCWDDAPAEWDYYNRQAENGRPQDAIAGIGRNLEKFFYRMRANLGLAVPAKPNGDYTIGDLYGPFFEWLNKRAIVRIDRPDFAHHLQLIKKELDEVWPLRNWSGAHFNEWGEQVTAAEAISFSHTVRRLVEAFECPVCQDLVAYNYHARVLICPTCDPTPPPNPTWLYRGSWHTTALHLLGAPDLKKRRNIIQMVQNDALCFLLDMRRRVNLPIQATADNHYRFQHIYEPLMAWAIDHPRHDIPDWSLHITRAKAAVDGYHEAGTWYEVSDEDIPAFVEAIHQLTGCFSCADCGQLLNYDYESVSYRCADCQDTETAVRPLSAYWFVKKK